MTKKYRFGCLGMLGQMYNEDGEEVNFPDGTEFYLTSDIDRSSIEPTAVDTTELLAAAKIALDEMCRTTAPRNSFTDAVDRLDAAISNAEKSNAIHICGTDPICTVCGIGTDWK